MLLVRDIESRGRPPWWRWGVDSDRSLVDCLSRMTEALDSDRSASTVDAPNRRSVAETALLDAAERLLLDVGGAGITTRRLAEEAGVNHGLVHYYFDSVENLLMRVLERFTNALIARQRELYAADMPYIEKWRAAMRYLEQDRPYQKVWFELQALAWNRPELRTRIVGVNDAWRAVLAEAFAPVREELRIEMPLEALVSLVITFNEGIMLERLSGIETGQRELLAWIEEWVADGGS